jgi:hypothetical protein
VAGLCGAPTSFNRKRIEHRTEWHGGLVTKDFGLVFRARRPEFKNRVVIFMAGAHSLGTGAACSAATRTQDVAQISNRLKPGSLITKNDVSWALVEGTRGGGTGAPDQLEARGIDTGTLTPFSNSAYAGH